MSASRSRRESLSARAATVAALAVALALGASVGLAWPTGLAVVGALVVAWGVTALSPDTLARTAAGSVALVAGSAVFAGAFAFVGSGDLVVLAPLALAALVVALESADGFADESLQRLRLAASESGIVAVVGLAVIAVLAPALGSDAAATLFGVGAGTVTSSRIAAFWWLQVGVLAAGFLLPRAVDRFDRLVHGPDASSESLGTLADRFEVSPAQLPTWYVVAFVGQFFLAWTVGANSFVDGFVADRPVVGGAIDAVLLSGIVHGIVLAVVVLLCAMLSVTHVQRAVRRWAGDAPGERGAVAAGGAAAVAVGAAVAVLAGAGALDPLLTTSNDFWGPFTVLRTVAPLLAGAVVGLLAVTVSVVGVQFALGVAAPTGRGYAVAAALVFAGTVLAAGSIPAWGVVAGVGVAVLVWDLGTHAAVLDRDLATAGPSTRTELVHLTATGLVVTVAVAVAVAVGYHLVPVTPPNPGERATVALGLALVSVVSFAVALQR